jgi:hypothetical protein
VFSLAFKTSVREIAAQGCLIIQSPMGSLKLKCANNKHAETDLLNLRFERERRSQNRNSGNSDY